MKKLVSLFLILAGSTFAVFSASYKNNTYQKLAEQYTAKSQKALDAGQYALAEEYAHLAQENAALSEEFIQKHLAMSNADDAIAKAKSDLDQVKKSAGEIELPAEYTEAQALYDKAQEAYKAGDYAAAKTYAEESSAKSALAMTGLDILLAKTGADQSRKAAQERITYVESIRGKENFPLAYQAAVDYYSQSTSAYEAKDYASSKALADNVLTALADVKEMTPLPKFYVVRPWAETKDCFWNISGRPYVYNNPFLWENLYEVNKGKLPQKNNPNLILPGMVMEIPSITGEYRDGYYSPSENYQAYNGR